MPAPWTAEVYASKPTLDKAEKDDEECPIVMHQAQILAL